MSEGEEEETSVEACARHLNAVWVQCGGGAEAEGCGKWRQLRRLFDPSVLPDVWLCSMNDEEAYNSCEAAQEEWTDEGDADTLGFIESPFANGSVVWARSRSGKHLWCPAMVTPDARRSMLTTTIAHSQSTEADELHVQYFGKRFFDEWLPADRLRSYHNWNPRRLNLLTADASVRRTVHNWSYPAAKYARAQADAALAIDDVRERLLRYVKLPPVRAAASAATKRARPKKTTAPAQPAKRGVGRPPKRLQAATKSADKPKPPVVGKRGRKRATAPPAAVAAETSGGHAGGGEAARDRFDEIVDAVASGAIGDACRLRSPDETAARAADRIVEAVEAALTNVVNKVGLVAVAAASQPAPPPPSAVAAPPKKRRRVASKKEPTAKTATVAVTEEQPATAAVALEAAPEGEVENAEVLNGDDVQTEEAEGDDDAEEEEDEARPLPMPAGTAIELDLSPLAVSASPSKAVGPFQLDLETLPVWRYNIPEPRPLAERIESVIGEPVNYVEGDDDDGLLTLAKQLLGDAADEPVDKENRPSSQVAAACSQPIAASSHTLPVAATSSQKPFFRPVFGRK